MNTQTAHNYRAAMPTDFTELREVYTAARKGRVDEWKGERREGVLKVYEDLAEAALEAMQEQAPATLTVHVNGDSDEIEVRNGGGATLTTGPEFAVLAGRTATKTRPGSLSFALATPARTDSRGKVRESVWAEDADGNTYASLGVIASGNKGQYGCRIVGHVSRVEITAKV